EAGDFMAFPAVPVTTPIISACSVGSINAVSYASRSEGLVGKADSLVQSWIELTPATLGIDWSRYILLLAGLVAASAGLGNFVREWLQERGIYMHAHHPLITWLSLALAGIAILFLSDGLSYIIYVALRFLRKGHWEVDRRKAVLSAAGNLLVLTFLVLFLGFTHLHVMNK